MLPSPSLLLGLDGKFPDWYPGQESAFVETMNWLANGRRFFFAGMPTGSGKSLTSIGAAKLSGRRTVILTATKGLQEQIMKDFRTLGVVDIRGQNSFPCLASEEVALRCDEGPCHEGIHCSYKEHSCPYYMRLREATGAQIVVTNYAYYLAQTNYSDGLGERELLICDEAHLAIAALESYLSVYIGRDEVEGLGRVFPNISLANWTEWKRWAATVEDAAHDYAESLKDKIRIVQREGQRAPSAMSKAYKTASTLEKKAGSLARARGEWVWERRGQGWYFTPIWPGKYSDTLFHDTEKIMAMSAVLTTKMIDSLQVLPNDYTFIETPSYFPPDNTPVIHVPAARINNRSTPTDMQVWLNRIDQILDRRQDRKGIIFTTSYQRRDWLLQRSRHKDIMLTHGRGDVIEMVNRFRRSDPPAVLLSPAVTSGWDFPGDSCEYIIIAKLPYPNTNTPVMKARTAEDNEWTSFMAMETIVQECGRGSRSADDKCEVLIVDDNWRWFWKMYKKFAPAWFAERVKGSVNSVPMPPER